MAKMAYFVGGIQPSGILLRGAIEATMDIEVLGYAPSDIVPRPDDPFEGHQKPDVIVLIDEWSDDLREIADDEKAFETVVGLWRSKFSRIPFVVVCKDSNMDYEYLKAMHNVKRVDACPGANTDIGAFSTLCRAIMKAIKA